MTNQTYPIWEIFANNFALNSQNELDSLNTPTERIVHLLRKCGLNPPEIALKVETSDSTVYRWLSGETTHISKNKRGFIANILGFDSQWIEDGVVSNELRLEEPKMVYKTKEGKKKDLESLKERLTAFDAEAKDLLKRFHKYSKYADDQDMLRDALEKIEDLLIEATERHLK